MARFANRKPAAATTTTASDPSLESFAVSSGIAQTGRRTGQSYAVVTLWANGRPTQSKLYADNKAHLLSLLERAYTEVESWTEPTTTAAPVVQTAQSPDMAAMLAEMARLQAENAALAGKAAPVAAAVPAPVAAVASATQARLSRIARKA